ncbi:MAG: radical SAM protein [Chloroflexota bacterium]|nr:radical SAM protein [Chloroflexota bacterium]
MFSAAFVTPEGKLREATGNRPVAAHGRTVVPLAETDLIPLPEGAVLSMMPERTALCEEGELPGAPAAALLPIGYTRTLLPAYRRAECRVHLPLFGYAAVAMRDGRPYVAAMATDDPRPWQHNDAGYRQLRRLIRRRIAERNDGAPLLRHLAHCALTYECRSAQHLFYGRGEAALPSSPICNAACVGCISEQPDASIQPHERLSFLPSVDESVDLAVSHLERSGGGIVSFGQGCEGEPLLNKQNLEIVRRVRRRTRAGVINLNTNGSRPQILRQLIDAGLGSIRVSMFSARDAIFPRYYKPVGYSLCHVAECLRMASAGGLLTSVNLLTFPGITDDEDEVGALLELFRSASVELVQLRNLNIDPEQLLEQFEDVTFRPIGIRTMAERFQEAGLRIGSYTHVRGKW